jgi:hypothetical protein
VKEFNYVPLGYVRGSVYLQIIKLWFKYRLEKDDVVDR